MLDEAKSNIVGKVFIMLFILVLGAVFSLNLQSPTADIAFATESEAVAASVGDSQMVTFIASPIEACQDCTWTLTWDQTNTSAITYSVIKDKNPYDYLSLDTDGCSCTITVLKYHKVAITYTVYLTLTATSTENTDLSATCTIKLG